MDGVCYKGGVDSGAQVLTITISVAKDLGLEKYRLDKLLDTEGMGDIEINMKGILKSIYRFQGLEHTTKMF